jgi:hypothetical protein
MNKKLNVRLSLLGSQLDAVTKLQKISKMSRRETVE